MLIKKLIGNLGNTLVNIEHTVFLVYKKLHSYLSIYMYVYVFKHKYINIVFWTKNL